MGFSGMLTVGMIKMLINSTNPKRINFRPFNPKIRTLLINNKKISRLGYIEEFVKAGIIFRLIGTIIFPILKIEEKIIF
jgi:hypothetical protein